MRKNKSGLDKFLSGFKPKNLLTSSIFAIAALSSVAFVAKDSFAKTSNLERTVVESPARDSSKSSFDLFIDMNLKFEYHPEVISASNFPVDIRRVPVHAQDRKYYHFHDDEIMIDIMDTKLSYRPTWFLPSIGAGATYSYKPFRIRTGINLAILFDYYLEGEEMHPDDTIQEYDYLHGGGEKRTEGSALVYYGLFFGNHFTPEFYVELSKDVTEKINVFLEYNRLKYSIEVQNGWDRYNSLDTMHRYGLSDFLSQSVKIGIQSTERPNTASWPNEPWRLFGKEIYGSSQAYLGYSFIDSKIHPISGLNVKTTSSQFFIGGNISFKLNLN